MVKASVLVIEDEEDIREIIAFNLKREGYSVLQAETAEKGLNLIKNSPPDIVLLDMMLPGMDGFDALKIIRADKETKGLPVIMVTARSEDSDIVAGLELGADDYLCKPFSPRVLIARVRARLRETGKEKANAVPGQKVLSQSGIILDSVKHNVTVDAEPVTLSASEFSLLEFFLENPGHVFSRQRLIDALRGPDYAVTDRSIDVQILGLRKKLGRFGELVETVRGFGYRFKGNP